MTGNLDIEELAELVERAEIDTVLAVFPDHLGRLLGKRLTGTYFLEGLERGEVGACNYLLTADMEMNPLPGFAMAGWDKGYGDFALAPDVRTLRRIPWLPQTALVMCDLVWENGEPVVQSPRAILRRQCDLLAERGMKAYVGSELEFYLFLDTHSSLRQRGFKDIRPSSQYRIDYHILQTSSDESVIREIRNAMCAAGIPVEYSKGEWGSGQHEICLCYADALEMADRHAIYKNGAREIATSRGAAISFMAKYNATEAGSGLHIHTSLFDADSETNLFWDGGANGPTDTFRYFMGGLLHLSREFCLFFAPTINAYKRYQETSFAPTRIAWDYDNRTTGFRIIGHGQSFRVENRMPGADANPYLAYAATLAAGLYGIENKIDCKQPFKGNAYAAEDLPQLPSTLREATDLFDRSATARSCFGDDVVDHYVHSARLEQQAFDKAVTDWELYRYFERI